ncbi:putative snare-dependent exocytosis protein [Terfezia claveryi]|nr:putative snare-dependent exocytosis protein [Terfezia claveryi]
MDFLRAKQTGIQNDLSRSLSNPDMFLAEVVSTCGVASQISTVVFDPVQSLLAVGTYVSQDGLPGEIHIFGQKRIQVTFQLQRKASVKYIKFCDKKLVVLDSKHDLTIISLESRTIEMTYSPPGGVNAIVAETGLDWVFLGLQNGEVIAYDLDRLILSPFQIPNLWKERSTKAILSPVVSLAIHPRDIGTLLVGYLEGAVVFSIKKNEPTLFLQFELPPGAPGADTDPALIQVTRKPKLSHAVWHPTGTFILTTHEDSCMVFWDTKDGRIVQTRTIQDSHVHIPGAPLGVDADPRGVFDVREPIFRVAWCSGENPENTSLVIAGGNSMGMHAKGLTLLELGNTPPYLTSSWEVLSEHFASPKRQRILPTPTNAGVVDFCLIPKTSPHYAGANDPVAVLAILESGELALLNFPDGQPLSPTYLLPVSLCLVHPQMNLFNVTMFNRQKWLGMEEKRVKPPVFLEGGSPLCKPNKRYEIRTVVQTAHRDGAIRIWDASHADELENADVIEVDMVGVLQRAEGLTVKALKMSGMTGEMAVGMESGEMVMLNWRKASALPPVGLSMEEKGDGTGKEEEPIVDIRSRSHPRIREGMLPLFMLKDNTSEVKVVECSDVGFVAVGHADGQLRIIDLRGPAIIYDANLTLAKEHKRRDIRKSLSHEPPTTLPPVEFATNLAFSVLTLDGDEYSSITLLVGTSLGRVGTFKILPAESGKGYKVEFCGVTSASLDEPVVGIIPLNTETGQLALATQYAVLGLRNGAKVPGAVVMVTKSEARIYKLPSGKGVGKSWVEQGYVCVKAGVIELESYGVALMCLMLSGVVKVYSIPALKDVTELKASGQGGIDLAHISEAQLLPTGDIVALSSQTCLSTLTVFGAGKGQAIGGLTTPTISGSATSRNPTRVPADELYNPLTPPPPRPTISTISWLAGTQYLSTADLDLLIGGPDRPPSKSQVEAERAMVAEERAQARQSQMMEAQAAGAAAAGGSTDAVPGKPQGIWAGLQQGFNERTKHLGMMGENMDRLGQTSKGFSDEVARLVKEQKKKALWGGVKSKFF